VPVVGAQIPQPILNSESDPCPGESRAGSADAANDLIGVLIVDAKEGSDFAPSFWGMLSDGHTQL
jgi:hypothetical protein